MKMLAIFLTVAAAGLTGCIGRRLTKSPDLSRAEGKVSFRRTRDEQTRIDVAVVHLPQPEELNPPGYLYVAWIKADRETPAQNIGALDVDKDLKGELSALTPLHRFDFFVTAESSPEIENPSGQPLLWARLDD